MDNDAFVAALGAGAVAAVDGYRSGVILESARRGVRMVVDPVPDPTPDARTDPTVDPIDIRLRFLHRRGRSDLAGRTLHWCPARGWSMSHCSANSPLSYYAGPAAAPLLLVPPVPAVLDWALGDLHGPTAPPVGVELDDEPIALRRLRSFVDAADGARRRGPTGEGHT